MGCPLTGPEGINLPGSGEPAQSEPAKCPDASKVGTVEVISPLADHPLAGNVYLAKQGENPFGSLIALYIAVNDPATGVVVKLAGKVEPNPLTGQLVTSFEDNPQLPFEEFKFDFSGGPRAPLHHPAHLWHLHHHRGADPVDLPGRAQSDQERLLWDHEQPGWAAVRGAKRRCRLLRASMPPRLCPSPPPTPPSSSN